MKTEQEKVKLDFYALGRLENNPELHSYNTNRGMKDTSNDLLIRNALSLNSHNLENIRNSYRNLKSVEVSSKETNNYLNPILQFKTSEKYSVAPNMTNRETYNLTKAKYFHSDKEINLNSGMKVSKEEFITKKKESENIMTISKSYINQDKIENCENNTLVFDKTTKDMIRYPKGYWGFNAE